MNPSFAIQFFPAWLAVVILIAVAFGVWKLATLAWAAIAGRRRYVAPTVARTQAPTDSSSWRGGCRSALGAIVKEHVAPCLARPASIEQSQAAVHTEVGLHIAGGHQRAFAARADVGRDLLQGILRRERAPSLRLGLPFDLLPLRDVAPLCP